MLFTYSLVSFENFQLTIWFLKVFAWWLNASFNTEPKSAVFIVTYVTSPALDFKLELVSKSFTFGPCDENYYTSDIKKTQPY